MKKMTMAVLVVVALLISGAAMAIDFGSVVDEAGKMGSKMGIDKALKDAKCAFQKNSTQLTCDVNKLSGQISAIIQGAKAAKNWHVDVHITADNSPNGKLLSYARGEAARDQLRKGLAGVASDKYWNYTIESTSDKGNNLKLSAEVR